MRLAPDERTWRRWLAIAVFLATAANFVSIAAAHTLLTAGLALLVLRPRSVQGPRAAWPLAALLVWTLIATAASDVPSDALPQIKKFFVFAVLPLAYTAFRTTDQCRRCTEAWFAVVLLASAVGAGQFALAAIELPGGGEFYSEYVDDRITGFHSHWMTFSQSSALVLVTLLCYVAFGRRREGSGIWQMAAGLIGCALVLSFTRSVWLAVLACVLYIVAIRRPRALLAVPLIVAAAYLVAPSPLRQRVRSIQPADNQARIVMWRTGLNMIRDRPLLGVGPERAGPLFAQYQPPDVEQLPPGFYGHLHNVYIHFAAERGIPAALIVLWLFGQVLWDLRQGLARLGTDRDDRRYLLHSGIAATLAIAILSCFDVSLGDSEVLAAYLALVAMAYRAIPRGASAEG